MKQFKWEAKTCDPFRLFLPSFQHYLISHPRKCHSSMIHWKGSQQKNPTGVQLNIQCFWLSESSHTLNERRVHSSQCSMQIDVI